MPRDEDRDLDPVETVDLDDPDELAEELGYASWDWSRLPAREVAEHDRIIELSGAPLRALDLERLGDLELWAAAQAFASEEDDKAFERIARRLVFGEARHPAIAYGEICAELAGDMVFERRWDDALELAARFEALEPDDTIVARRIEAAVRMGQGRVDEGLDLLQELIDENEDDATLLLALAGDLVSAEQFDLARRLLEGATDAAMDDNDQDLLAEIAAFQAAIEEMEAGGGES